MRNTEYFLSNDAFICEAQDYWVVLDAKNDKYLCIPCEELKSIAPWLHGFSPVSSTYDNGDADDSVQRTIQSFVSKGILTDRASHGKPFTPCKVARPIRSLIELENTSPIRLTLKALTVFLVACLDTEWRLRRCSLKNTLSRIETRKYAVASHTDLVNEPLLTNLQRVFFSLRPFYPRPYLCLFESIALLEFLSYFQFFPQIVFGVVADPFEAHCWLQEGSVLINEDLERLVKYTTVLAK